MLTVDEKSGLGTNTFRYVKQIHFGTKITAYLIAFLASSDYQKEGDTRDCGPYSAHFL